MLEGELQRVCVRDIMCGGYLLIGALWDLAWRLGYLK